MVNPRSMGLSNTQNRLRFNTLFDFMGDSRSADLMVAGPYPLQKALQGTHWFYWANFFLGGVLQVGTVHAFSGKRSDEYIQLYHDQAVASKAGWVVIGFPFVNDLAKIQIGAYTDAFGNSITTANFVSQVTTTFYNMVKDLLAVGKKVIVTQEPGATNLNATTVQYMHELNDNLVAMAEFTQGLFCWSANKALWNPTSSSTVIGFKTGVLRTGDTTHYSVLGGKAAGRIFADFISGVMGFATWSDVRNGHLSNVLGTNPRQLCNNTLFNTTSGGTRTGPPGTGNVPASWTLLGGAGTTVNLTYAADPDGYGNRLTLDCTFTGADLVRFRSATPSASAWTILDPLQWSFNMSVAAGSLNAYAYGNFQRSVNGGGTTIDNYAGYAVSGLEPFPTDAYAGVVQTRNTFTEAGDVSTSFLTPDIQIRGLAAGNITVTVWRPSVVRKYPFALQ
jgi:hypothetical protein